MVSKIANRNTGVAFPLFALSAFLLIAGLTLIVGSLRDGAGAAERSVRTVTLGGGSLPKPACPLECEVIASVSGFQLRSPIGDEPYVVPFDGKLRNFRLFLGKPTAGDRRKLNDRFGGPPQAAVTVLKQIKARDGSERFKLLAKSPVEDLDPELGTVATFKLAQPLNVRKGNVIALAVPTWAPAFAAGLDTGLNRWRASRQAARCSNAFVDRATSQLKVNSERPYGCTFRGGRLLYTVSISNQ